MSESSRIETLLEALVDGENVDVVPQSRIETYLLALLNGDTNVKEPQSRIEAYLYQLCKNGMSGGGITPTGTLEITENGTHDVTNYASANVNVASSGGGDLDALIDGSITEVVSNVESVIDYAFSKCESLVKVTLPNAKSIGEYALGYCNKLISVDLPLVESIDSYAFYNCFVLETVNIPFVNKLNGSTFYNCYKLTAVDLQFASKIGNNEFNGCCALKKLILRSETMCSLSNTNIFSRCYHFLGTVNATYNPDGLKDGYIYVPSALIEQYKVATNWTTFASQFRALEDYTVDGTITGELDETKI